MSVVVEAITVLEQNERKGEDLKDKFTILNRQQRK
jgi:hypothetical protein